MVTKNIRGVKRGMKGWRKKKSRKQIIEYSWTPEFYYTIVITVKTTV